MSTTSKLLQPSVQTWCDGGPRSHKAGLCRPLAVVAALAALWSGPALADVSTPVQLPVVAVNDSTNDGDLPANVLDGSLATRWSASGSGQWISFDLGTVQAIGSLNIAWYEGNTRTSYFEIQTSADDANWHNVFIGQSSGTNLNPETYPLVDSSGRYVRIVGFGNSVSTWNSITEVQILSPPSTNMSPGLSILVDPASSELATILNGKTIALTWDNQAGATYSVLTSSNLITWKSIGASFTNTSSVQVWSEHCTNMSRTALTTRFYRVANMTSSPPPTNSLVAAFGASPLSGVAPLAVTFTDQSTGGPTSWSWVFGDGGTSTAQSPSHTYAAQGTYTATLTVRDSAGDTSSNSVTIQVNALILGGSLPSQVLDLLNWKLTLPIGSAGSPTEIDQPALASFVDPNYFYVNAAGNGVVFTAPCGGVTTSGSSYPRSELREMTNNGSAQASWSTTSGTHTMEITEAIMHLPVAKPQVIAGQIHDASTKVVDCRLAGSKLYIENPSGGTVGVLTSSYQLGTEFTVKFVASNGGIAIYYNGTYMFTYSVSESGLYFKTGDYTQSNTSTGDSATAYGQVVVYGVTVSHQ